MKSGRPGRASQSVNHISSDLLKVFLHLRDDQGLDAISGARSILAQTKTPAAAHAAGVMLRIAYWLIGDSAAFIAAGRQVLPNDPSHRSCITAQMERSIEAMIELRQLRLPMASRLSRDVLEAARPGVHAGSTTILPRIVLAQIAYEHGDFPGADSAIRAVLPHVRTTLMAEAAVGAYVTIARAAIRRGRSEFAVAMLTEGETLGSDRSWPRLSAACLGERIDLMLALKRTAEAVAAFDRLQRLSRSCDLRGESFGESAIYHELARCRMMTLSGVGGQEISTLQRMLSVVLPRGDVLLGVRLKLRLAAALARAENRAAAAETMHEVVRISCESGLYQTILDAEEEVRELLLLIQDRLPTSYLRAYVTTLLEHWPQPPSDNVSRGEKRSEGMLTGRERTVLHLMSLGQSNKLIAQRLGIAPETVKSHAKNILARLGSGTRTEAVTRAVSLGML